MYIVFITGISMGKRFESWESKEMGEYIIHHVRKGCSARVELFI